MIRQPDRLAQRPFDLLVIGGGILGAGIARDAALRGLSVALVEQGDFVSGASSKTTKLIHGGLRYLEQWDLQLVREACRERRTLLTIAPHLVTPLPFVLPVYRDGPRPAWKIRAGVALYDWLAGPAKIAPHRFYAPRRVRDLEPSLPSDRLAGAAEFHDAQMNDVRLCLDTLFSAAEAGAVAVNHARVVRFHIQKGRVAGAEVESTVGPGAWLVQARVVVNAAGPWADAVRRLADPQASRLVRRSKGIHVVYPRLPLTRAVVLSAHRDGRIFFVIPWRGWSLIGATDTDYDAAPEQARATPEDVAYLLEETNRLLPGLGLAKERIITTFAGVRPLVAGGHDDKVPWHVSRAHLLHEDVNGLLSIIGGKYTTYRAIAEAVVDRAVQRLGRAPIPCRTAAMPLGAVPSTAPGTVPDQGAVPGRAGAGSEPLCPHHPFTAADVRRAVEQEAAVTLGDVLWRRLQVAWAPCQGLDCAEAAARVMADALGWDAAGLRRQIETYRAEVLANHSAKD